MTPLFFGTGARRLFGIYFPARGRPRRRSIVLCHPWGPEYIRAHRAMRQLSRLLADAGFDVLGFDYFGTGDSAGDMLDADVTGWLDDIDTAIEELMDTTEATTVTLVGLRLGATLASLAAARRGRNVESLVLWDPIHHGPEYLKALTSTPGWVRPRPAEAGGGHEISGFPLSEALTRQIGALQLPEPGDRGMPTFVLYSQPGRTQFTAGDPTPAGHVVLEELPHEPPWADEDIFGSRPLPVKALHRIVEWLS